MPKRPFAGSPANLTAGAIRDDLGAKRKLAKMDPSRGGHLGVARVTLVNFEEFYVSLRTVVGTATDFDRIPIPMTFPGAGARHFFGAMPEIGDHCIVGWMPMESGSDSKGTKHPVILQWIIPGVMTGREWLTTAAFTPDEFDFGSAKDREVTRAVFDRIRHKLRHVQPGNIVASSSQGSDLVLDEGVTLANRRCNEIRLRDQDQALVVRSLQQFHAMAGARIYAGMVQRDALSLPTAMISDGKDWDTDIQLIDGEPVHESDLPQIETEPENFLTPSGILLRQPVTPEEGYVSEALLELDDRLDPYSFLRRGGYVDEGGFMYDPRVKPDSVYGGKPVFRISSTTGTNTAAEMGEDTLTEYRLEVSHTSDGLLPVTEQTDMFDADRLPRSDNEVSDPGGIKAPFIEFVLGSVVGNDPFSRYGKDRYGLPLVVSVFDARTDQPNPRIDPVQVDDNGYLDSLEEHAATLFKMSPPIGGGGPDTFWSVNKGGQLKAAIGGPETGFSVEAALRGGLKLQVGGEFRLLLNEGIRLGGARGDATENIGASLESEQGAVVIKGGGQLRGVEDTGGRTVNNSPDLPAVKIDSNYSTHINANQNIVLKGAQVETRAPSVKVQGYQETEITSADRVSISGKVTNLTTGGKRTESFSGPKDNNITNGPLHEVTYTPSPAVGSIESLKTVFEGGSRVEEFELGDHETTMKVGNLTYQTEGGTWKARAGQNSLTISTDGMEGKVTSGNLTLKATAGTAELSGSTGVTIESSGGQVTIRGTTVHLGAPVDNDQGAIVCGGSIEPFTGSPFSSFGIGAKRHIVGS
jgi:hypothetical protein